MRTLRKRWSLQSPLHRDVASVLKQDGLRFKFHDVDDEQGVINEFDSHVMGRFVCGNKGCPCTGWGSRRIAVTIRQYEGKRYNARVYHQRCRKCGEVGGLRLDGESYVQRVSYRIRKWNGVEVEEPPYRVGGRLPHDGDLCCGCAVGRCYRRRGR